MIPHLPLLSTAHLVWVVLVTVICDQLAASKVGGFTSHSHQIFCLHDMVLKKDLCITKCFKKDSEGFIEIGIIKPNMMHLQHIENIPMLLIDAWVPSTQSLPARAHRRLL